MPPASVQTSVLNHCSTLPCGAQPVAKLQVVLCPPPFLAWLLTDFNCFVKNAALIPCIKEISYWLFYLNVWLVGCGAKSWDRSAAPGCKVSSPPPIPHPRFLSTSVKLFACWESFTLIISRSFWNTCCCCFLISKTDTSGEKVERPSTRIFAVVLDLKIKQKLPPK